MNWDVVLSMLEEFDYRKNGKEDTISFLVYVLNMLINGGAD